MEENDQNNEEYKFGEFDSLEGEGTGVGDSVPGDTTEEKSNQLVSGLAQNPVFRNALIVVGVVLVGLLGLRFIAPLFTKPEQLKPAIAPMASAVSQPALQTAPAEIAPVPATSPPPTSALDSSLNQKVVDIEANQLTIKSEVSTVSQQMGAVNTNVSNLGEQMSKLNQVILELSNQVAQQSIEINRLMAKARPKPVKRPTRRVKVEYISYSLQAVIPGRAWIIGSNGSTLTVRVGTKIPGYGMVRLIDSIQGRVLMSSGRTIRFSQADS